MLRTFHTSSSLSPVSFLEKVYFILTPSKYYYDPPLSIKSINLLHMLGGYLPLLHHPAAIRPLNIEIVPFFMSPLSVSPLKYYDYKTITGDLLRSFSFQFTLLHPSHLIVLSLVTLTHASLLLLCNTTSYLRYTIPIRSVSERSSSPFVSHPYY